MPSRQTGAYIRVDLDPELKARFVEECRSVGTHAGPALRAAVIARVGDSPPAFGMAVGDEQGARTDQVRVSTSASEREAIARMADHYAIPQSVWVGNVVRAALTGEPDCTSSELETLRRSNRELLTAARSIAQLARRIDEDEASGASTLELVRAMTALVERHTDRVDRLVRACAERWPLVERSS